MTENLPSVSISCFKKTKGKLQSCLAQLDACLTGDQDVAGSNTAGSATFLSGD